MVLEFADIGADDRLFQINIGLHKARTQNFCFFVISPKIWWGIPCRVVFVNGLLFWSIFLLLFIYCGDKIDASWNC